LSNIALWVKNQKKSVVIDLKTKIKDFEEKYKKLWFHLAMLEREESIFLQMVEE